MSEKSKEKSKYLKVIESSVTAFDDTFLKFIEQIKGNIEILIKSWKYQHDNESTQNSNGKINKFTASLITNPHRLNFFVSKIIKIHKRKLIDELRQQFDQIKQNLNSDTFYQEDDDDDDEPGQELDLYKEIDLNQLIKVIDKRVHLFEKICDELIGKARQFQRAILSQNNNQVLEYDGDGDKYTDFSSDTEHCVSRQYADKKLILKILNNWLNEDKQQIDQLQKFKINSLIQNLNKSKSLSLSSSSSTTSSSYNDLNDLSKKKRRNFSETDDIELFNYSPFKFNGSLILNDLSNMANVDSDDDASDFDDSSDNDLMTPRQLIEAYDDQGDDQEEDEEYIDFIVHDDAFNYDNFKQNNSIINKEMNSNRLVDHDESNLKRKSSKWQLKILFFMHVLHV